MVSTQASQLRITQRQHDSGWIVAQTRLERLRNGEWVSADCVPLSSVLEVNSRAITYHGVFLRTSGSPATPYRLYLGDNNVTATQVQRAGSVTHIKPDGTHYEYLLEFTTDAHLQPVNMNHQTYQISQTDDVLQYTASWSII